jgi:hypothetical protein
LSRSRAFRACREAVVARSFLEAHEHVVVATEYNHASVAWHHLLAIGGVGLSAPEPEAEQMRTLLAARSSDGIAPMDPAAAAQNSPGVVKRCLSVVLLFALFVIVPPHVMKRRPAL